MILFLCVLLFSCIIKISSLETNSSSPYLNDNLRNLYSEYNHFNVIIPKLDEYHRFLNRDLTLPFQDSSSPYWLRMANQALFLDYTYYKNTKLALMKLDMAKKVPYLRKLTNVCLSNPWSNRVACSLKKITKNIEFLCLIDNSNPDFVSDSTVFTKFKYSYDSANDLISSDYKLFCWMIYGINYLEQCQLRLMIDESDCSISNIEFMINLILVKLNSTEQMNKIYTNNLKLIYKHYSSLFIERSMQILTQLLILVKNQDFANNERLNYEKIQITRFHLERLLTYLLNGYIIDKLNKLPKFFLLDDYHKSKEYSYLITQKLRDLNHISLKFIMSKISNTI